MMTRLRDLAFILIALLYLEMVFRIVVFDSFFSWSLGYIFLFTVLATLVIYLLVSFFNHRINKLLLAGITLLLAIMYSAQVVYYNYYNAIFSFYSLKQANQVAEFAGEAGSMIFKNIVPIAFLFVPFIYLIFNHRKFYFRATKKRLKVLALLLIIIVYCISVLSLKLDKNDMYSAYNLYHKDHVPVMMADKLGLLTEMRIDFSRALFGFKGSAYTYTKNKKDKKDSIEEEAKVTYQPNTLNVDFDQLIKNSADNDIKNIHSYFSDVDPTYKNEYTGMFKGKNLIMIMGEALHTVAVRKDLTPTLYKMVHEGFNFTNFYVPIFPVSTSDGEYIFQTSLFPKANAWSLKRSYQNALPFTMAHMMLKEGYTTTAYHGHSGTYYARNLSIPNLGYQHFYACKLGLNINCKQWPEDDVEVVQASVPQYINKDHFLTYYISISGHLNYRKTGNMMVYKNWKYVKDLPYSDFAKGYIAAQMQLDKSLELLINELDKAGKLEDTVIAICPDHFPYGLTLEQMNELSTYTRDDDFEKHHSVFIVWNSEMKAEKVDTLSSNMDVLPTLANLFGMNYDSRLYMGRDIFSEHEPLVVFSNRSWITDKGRYNSLTKEYKGKKVNTEYMKRINKIIYDRFKISEMILDKNYFKYVKY